VPRYVVVLLGKLPEPSGSPVGFVPAPRQTETGGTLCPTSLADGTVILACESAIMDRGVRPVSTKCDIDVPDGQGFTDDETVKVTCKKCITALGARWSRPEPLRCEIGNVRNEGAALIERVSAAQLPG
jgi:hypothetical protein